MSIFDPYQLYYHRTRNTRKGQILQKKPTAPAGAISQSMVPGAINVLKSYGYQIISPNLPVFKTYFEAFNLKESNLETQNLTFTFNVIFRRLRSTIQRLQAFIAENPNSSTNHVAIALTSAIFFTYGGHVTFQFYNNGVTTINSVQTLADTENDHAYLFGPNINNNSYYLAYDNSTSSTTPSSETSGNIVARNRASQTDLPSILCHADADNKWSELISSSGLELNPNISTAVANNEATSINGYILQGYLLIELK